ncbi:unnamed protein product [Victoria cruziana]
MCNLDTRRIHDLVECKDALALLSKWVESKGLASIKQINSQIFKMSKWLTKFLQVPHAWINKLPEPFHGWRLDCPSTWLMVTANRVVDHLGEGKFAKVIAVEEDEPHIKALRSLNRNVNEITSQMPLFDNHFAGQ